MSIWNQTAAGGYAWENTTYWSGGTVGGSAVSDSTDVANFTTTLTGIQAANITNTRYLGGIYFANNTNFSYQVNQSTAGLIRLNSGGYISENGSGTKTDSVGCPIVLVGTATFSSSSFATAQLSIGTVSGLVSTGNSQSLTLNGSSTGTSNTVSTISDGANGGTLNVSKSGTGTWTLSASNTFSGTTQVTAGTLNISNVNGLQSSTVDWGTSTVGTLSLPTGAILGGLSSASGTANTFTRTVAYSVGNNNSDTTFSGLLSGAGALTKIGTGALTLTGASTAFTGGTTLNGGTIKVGNNSALGTNTVTITSGRLSSDGVTARSLTNAMILNGTVNLGDATSSGALTFSGATTIGTGATTLSIASGVTFSNTISISGALTANLGAGQSATLSAIISGSASVNFNSGGIWWLTSAGNPSYSGAVTVGGAVVRVGSNSAFGTNTVTMNSGGQITSASTNAYTLANALTLNGAVTLGDVSSLNGSLTFGGALTIASTTSLSINNYHTFNGTFTGTGAFTLSSGSLYLSGGVGTKSGGTTVSGGSGITFGFGVASCNQLGSDSLTINTLSSAQFAGSSSINIANAITGVGTLQAAPRNATITFTNTSGFTGRSFIICYVNDYNAGTTTQGMAFSTFPGSTNFQFYDAGIGSGPAQTIKYTGSADVTSSATIYAYSMGAKTSIWHHAPSVSTTSLTISGVVTSDTAGSHTFEVKNDAISGLLSMTGGINQINTGVVSLVKSGTGQVSLGGSSNFTGPVSVNAGTLNIGSSTALGNDTSTLSVTSGATLSISSIVTYNARNFTISGNGTSPSLVILYGGQVKLGSIITLGSNNAFFRGKAGGSELTSNISNSSSFTLLTGCDSATTFTLSGVISGVGAKLTNGFNSLDTGTVILSGANTYTGNTTLNYGFVRASVAENPGVSGPFGKQLANAAGTILMDGGTLQYSSSNTFDYSGRFSTAGSNTWRIDTNSQTVTFGSNLVGAGSSLYKTGSGNLQLSGNNTFTGEVLVNSPNSYLVLASAENPGVSGPLGNGGTIYLETSGGIKHTAFNSWDYSNRFTTIGNQEFVIDTNTQDVTWASNLSGNNSIIVKNGTGTLTLSGASTHSGGINIYGGVVRLNSAQNGTNSGPLGSGLIYMNGGTLQFTSQNNWDYSSQFYNGGTSLFDLDTNGQTVVLASAISGTGSRINKLGLGSLSISGANTFDGGVIITQGTLVLNGPEVINTSGPLGRTATISFLGGTLKYTPNNNWDYSSRFINSGYQSWNVDTNGQNVNFSSALSGTYSTITKKGSGTLTLSGGSYLYSGNTILEGGILQLNNSSLASTIEFSGGAIDSTTTAAISNDIILNNNMILGGTANFSLSTPNGINITSFATITVNTNVASISAALTGQGVSKEGSGSLNLTGNNTISTVNINEGTLIAGSSTALGPSNNSETISVSSGGSLSLSTAVSYPNKYMYINGSGASGSGALIIDNSGTSYFSNILIQSNSFIKASFSGAVNTTIQNSPGTENTLTLGSSSLASLDLSGSQITSAISVVIGSISNIGSVKLSTTNNYTGNTTLSYGTLVLNGSSSGSTSAITAGPIGTGSLSINGGSLDSYNFAVLHNALTINNSFSFVGSSSLDMMNDVSLLNDVTIDAQASILSFYGAISGSDTLTKSGAGWLALLNTGNNYSGGTIITNGRIIVSGSSTGSVGSITSGPIGTGALTIFGGSLNVSDDSTLHNDITLNGNFTFQGTANLVLPAPVTLSANSSINVNANSLSLLGNIGSSVYSISKTGSGSLILTGNNQYQGGTTITGGSIVISNNNAIGSGTLILNGGKINSSDNSERVISNPVVISNNSALGDSVNVGKITIIKPVNCSGVVSDISLDSRVSVSGRITNGGLRFKGTGTVNLYNANTFSGGATVDDSATVILNNTSSLGVGDVTLVTSNSTIVTTKSSITNKKFNVGGKLSILNGGRIKIGYSVIEPMLSFVYAQSTNFNDSLFDITLNAAMIPSVGSYAIIYSPAELVNYVGSNNPTIVGTPDFTVNNISVTPSGVGDAVSINGIMYYAVVVTIS